jgi:pyruvate dehydrogenase E1 component
MSLQTIEAPTTWALLEGVVQRAHAQVQTMIHIANHVREKKKGDPKVGGHPASCASSLHLLGALQLVVREPQDWIACKPHASPVDHAYHNLLGLFRDHATGGWLEGQAAKDLMTTLRQFPVPFERPVFQSYHAKSDPDSFHYLPSGTVGIPPVNSAYLALAYRYAKDHGCEVPEGVHFWSMMGDSEFREGSLLEVMPEVAERGLANVTWIVDYNRQNLDGTRLANEAALRGRDDQRIERTAAANGWKVLQVRHGKWRQELFARPDGAHLEEFFESGLSDYEYNMLLLKRDAALTRALVLERAPKAKKLVEKLSDADLLRALADLAGHCLPSLVEALRAARTDDSAPYMLVVHTIKGFGLECQADPGNHSALPDEKEILALQQAAGLQASDPFVRFAADGEHGRFLEARGAKFRAGILAHEALRERNRAKVAAALAEDGGVPDELGIDLSLFPLAHTQWMWGQLAAKLIRIGTFDEGGPTTAVTAKSLSPHDARWRTAADLCLTMSPDVGTSTNISPGMDQRVYGPKSDTKVEQALKVRYKHPTLSTSEARWTRHVRFEIAEANCMSAAGSLGKLGDDLGLPFLPLMTVYDFFVKRALDQLYYDLYWGSEFVLVGTPSGVTLSSEGAQHSWKSDIQMPNLVTWEPSFAIEMDWILSDAVRRHMERDNEGRKGVLIRAVTRGIQQKTLLECVRRHASSKAHPDCFGKLVPAGETGGLDESTVAPLSDDVLLQRVRAHCLAGAWHLVDWRGYAGHEPGDNVVHIFAMGALAPEALEASEALYKKGVHANVILVSSPELLLGILGEKSGYEHLLGTLGVDGDLHATAGAADSEAGLISLAGRRVPIVAVLDGEAGLLDNIGSIVGVKQKTLALRKFSKCGRPDEIYAYHHLDAQGIVEACGEALATTALEELKVERSLLERLAGREVRRRDWRELWPEAGGSSH